MTKPICNPIWIKSEPSHISTPITESEPPSCRNPDIKSEPSFMINPRQDSEPLVKRNPTLASEPDGPSKPSRNSEPQSDKERIRNLVEIYYDVQEVRMRSFNRLREVGEVQGVEPNGLLKLESQLKKHIDSYVNEQPIWIEFLSDIKGIGPILGGALISYLDPYKTQHMSSFWKYCGLHTENGKAVKRQKGKKTEYNPRAKVLAWKIADSMMKQRTPKYRDIYDSTKISENIKLNNPIENPMNCPKYSECSKRMKNVKIEPKECPCKMHIHNRAMRKMVKVFLGDLWLKWRILEGLPITPPYEHRNDPNWRYT